MAHFIIDCYSGGGAKGIAQLPYMAKVEKETGLPYWKTRDLIVGTSVGALNAAVLATGKVTVKEFFDKYEEMTRKIFTKRKWYEFPKFPIYKRDNFYKIWCDLIGEDFKMGDVKTSLMISTVNCVYDELGSEQTRFYKSWHADDAQKRLVDVVMDSFAAPMYFGTICHKDMNRVSMDGGVGFYNIPIDEAKLQSEIFGWYSDGNTVEINAIGCLFYVNESMKQFDKVCKESELNQLLQYLNLQSGGIARSMSRSDQIRKMIFTCNKIKTICFKYWDYSMPDGKMEAMDALQYLSAYKEFGIKMAQKPLISLNLP